MPHYFTHTVGINATEGSLLQFTRFPESQIPFILSIRGSKMHRLAQCTASPDQLTQQKLLARNSAFVQKENKTKNCSADAGRIDGTFIYPSNRPSFLGPQMKALL